MSLRDEFEKMLDKQKQNEEAYSKIALVGQPGAGKSSIINKLLGRKVAETGTGTDTTTEVKEYEYRFNKLVDLPGYGTEKFKFEEWKKEFQPEQYDVLLFVFKGKFTQEDNEMFQELWSFYQQGGNRHVFLIRNFAAELEENEREEIKQDIKRHFPNEDIELPLLFVDCRYKKGFEELHQALRKINYRKRWENRIREKFQKECDDYTNECRRRAGGAIDSHKKASAANGLNPLPGVDVGVDLGIYMDMFSDMRNEYGITDEDLESNYTLPFVRKLIELGTKNGIMLLLKNFASKVTAKSVLKYIPFIGQVASMILGYTLCEMAGESYLKQCDAAAKEIILEYLHKWEEEAKQQTILLLE